MLEALHHRGPDDQGLEVFEKGEVPVFLGHRRLSILDLSKAGHQPMYSADRKLCIVFNGEIYNYIELKRELSNSYDFQTNTDTEVLLAGYLKYGASVLQKLDGMFAFVIFDRAANKIFAARDPIGIKPFYYSATDDGFWFASEPQAILAGKGERGTYNSSTLSNFMLFGVSDYDQRTTLQGIQQLKGGHFIYQSPASILKAVVQEEFWSGPAISDISLPEAQEKYRKVLEVSVQRQLRSDVKLGSSLSGGIDSGAIVLTAGKSTTPASNSYSTLTFSFKDFPGDETEYARTVSKKAGFKWFAVEPETDRLAFDLEQMMTSMGEPFSTLSMFAQYKVMEKAHQLGIKVMLDGQGGDEVNLGYPRVAQMVMWEHLKNGNPSAFVREWIGFKKNANTPLWKSLAWYVYFNSAAIGEKRKLTTVGRWVDRDFLASYDREVAKDIFEPCSVYDRQYKELKKYILPRLLRFADRNSMAFSVESRVPHLAQPMLNYALSVPFQHRVYKGYTKFLERSALQGLMPDEVLWNPVKKGFDVPQAYWVEKLMPSINNWLDELPSDTPFKVSAIKTALNSGSKDSPYLWRVISSLALVQLKNYRFS